MFSKEKECVDRLSDGHWSLLFPVDDANQLWEDLLALARFPVIGQHGFRTEGHTSSRRTY